MRHLVRSERSVNGSLGSPNSSARRSGMRPLPFRAAFAATRRQEMLLSSKTCSVKHQRQVSTPSLCWCRAAAPRVPTLDRWDFANA